MEEVIESKVFINKMISTLGELPASPRIVSTIMKLTSDPNSDIGSLEKLLSADPSLAAKLLKLSNSSFYGQRKSVSTLKQAILIIGFYTLRSLVVATSIHNLYGKKNQNSVEMKLWEHSLATAIACRLLALRIRHPQLEEIFLAGLLHDIGKLVMSQKLSQKYEEICRKVESESTNFHLEEREALGFTHCDVGMMLLSKWNLPQELINAVYKHHNIDPHEYPNLSDLEHSKISIEVILEVGNQMAKQTGHGFKDCRVDAIENLPFAQTIGFNGEDFEEFNKQLEEEFQQELNMFEA